MADDWDSDMAEMRGSMGMLAPDEETKIQVMAIMGQVEAMLEMVNRAKTKEELQQVFGNVMQMLGPMMGGPAGPPPGSFD